MDLFSELPKSGLAPPSSGERNGGCGGCLRFSQRGNRRWSARSPPAGTPRRVYLQCRDSQDFDPDSPYSIYSRRHIPQAGPTGTVVVVEGRGLFLQLIGTSFPVTLSAVISEYCGSRFGTRLGSQWEAGPYTRSYSLTHQARKAAGQQGCIRVGGLSGKKGKGSQPLGCHD